MNFTLFSWRRKKKRVDAPFFLLIRAMLLTIQIKVKIWIMLLHELTPSSNMVSSMGSEIDQLCKICHILGMPDLTIFPEGTNTSRLLGIFSYEEVSFCRTGVQFLVFLYVCLSLIPFILLFRFQLQTFLISFQMLAQKLLTWFWLVLLILHASLMTFHHQNLLTTFEFSE